jgi:hypothetical protein
MYVLLHQSLQMSESLLEDIHVMLFNSNTESFVEFFTEKPSFFLLRVPFPIPTLSTYHDSLYYASAVAKYFSFQLHPGANPKDFAGIYDDTFSQANSYHQAALDGLGRYLQRNCLRAQPVFQEASDVALATLNSTAPLRESFRSFNSRLRRQVLSTPTAPVVDGYYQRSPIVEPISRENTFSNLPPYARVGPTTALARYTCVTTDSFYETISFRCIPQYSLLSRTTWFPSR